MTQGTSDVSFRRLGVQRVASDDDGEGDDAKPGGNATEVTAFNQEGLIVCFTLVCLADDAKFHLESCPVMYI